MCNKGNRRRLYAGKSLTVLKMISDRPTDHVKPSALLVGDPWVQEVVPPDGKKLEELPSAKDEVDMIGKILDVIPLTGKDASKDAVLKRFSTVQLVHIAAHGRMETGEIALSPNPSRESKTPKDEDYLLTMKEVLDAKLQARLVVLSAVIVVVERSRLKVWLVSREHLQAPVLVLLLSHCGPLMTKLRWSS